MQETQTQVMEATVTLCLRTSSLDMEEEKVDQTHRAVTPVMEEVTKAMVVVEADTVEEVAGPEEVVVLVATTDEEAMLKGELLRYYLLLFSPPVVARTVVLFLSLCSCTYLICVVLLFCF